MARKKKDPERAVYCKCDRSTWPEKRRLGTCTKCWRERPPMSNVELDEIISRSGVLFLK